MLNSKRTAVYFWSSTRRKHTLTNTWSSTHIKIHYQSSESKQTNKVIARRQEVEWAIERQHEEQEVE
jgi:hypothetical protein